MTHFLNLDYLKIGNARQQAAYQTLQELQLWQVLADYTPVLAGTIPLGIDIASSDLDILCEVADLAAFSVLVKQHYGEHDRFGDRQLTINGREMYVANFYAGDFEIEIFAQDCPVIRQNGYRHLVIEARLLELAGLEAAQAIRELKESGLKTEAAFAQYFKIQGADPYVALLEFENLSDAELAVFLWKHLAPLQPLPTVAGQQIERLWAVFEQDLKACFKRKVIFPIFQNAQIRKGKAYNYPQLCQMIGTDDYLSAARTLYPQLETQLFEKGYLQPCTACYLATWSPSGTLKEPPIKDPLKTCPVCFTDYPPLPSTPMPRFYRINPLLQACLKNGALTVLLARQAYEADLIHWQAGLMSRRYQTDIDLVLETSTGIVLIECKDNFKTDSASLEVIMGQLDKLQQMAQIIGAECAFATLVDTIPPVLSDYLTAHKIRILNRELLLS